LVEAKDKNLSLWFY